MKKQFYLLIALMVFVSARSYGQYPLNFTHPTGGNPITSFESFDIAGYGGEDDAEGFVQKLFCEEEETVTLSVEGEYARYEWYLMGKDEDTQELIVGEEGQTLSYAFGRSGYHRFRVYGFNGTGEDACFEITDKAIYVAPRIEIDATEVDDEFCENDTEQIENYNERELSIAASYVEEHMGDDFTLVYRFYLTTGEGEPVLLQEGGSNTYSLGTSDNDLDYTERLIAEGIYEYSVTVGYEFEGENDLCVQQLELLTLTINPIPEKPVIEITGGIGRNQ